ncbi:helix-turn-helix domain-containing protein [Flavobacteriaceae bacterium W22]|nr:helix-turn-helix domain-containing protein [Flavobacteriaceae bacterium W22]
MIKKIFTSFFIMLTVLLYAQDYYSKLREKYYGFEENDSRAFVFINQYIKKAKSENNHKELFQAYKDAILYSSNSKLTYADSAIAAAKKSGDEDLIGDAFLSKGAIYYFNQRKFQLALEEYLKAYEHLKDSKDDFLKYQNLYHIGVVKSYLGYYDEALEIFNDCIRYFETKLSDNLHKNLLFNNRKGYFNSLHQAIVCYQMLDKNAQADQLLKEGIKTLPDSKDFYLEKSYFNKSIGISEFRKKNYNKAIEYFDQSLPELIKVNDFTWISYIYYYKGRSYEILGNHDKEVENYKKVDSIFNKNTFILPELRTNYEELIEFYKKRENHKEELYYTNQLLKADSIIAADFKYLSTRVYKEYDTKRLLDTKEDLEKSNSFSKILLLFCVVVIGFLAFVIYMRLKKQKKIQKSYEDLLKKMEEKQQQQQQQPVEIPVKQEPIADSEKNIKFDNSIVEKLLKDIQNFEKNQGYLEQGLTLKKLAEQFKTNTSYLSQVINEYKGSNFNTYINVLRINFATEKIYHDKEWRKYSIEHIASAAGFSNRQSFSNIFLEQNGIRPADFIKKRISELEESKE